MEICQRDLFDDSFDVVFNLLPVDKLAVQSKRKQKRRRVLQPFTTLSLLPWLFPEEYPELQEAINAEMFIWTDDDISCLCEGMLEQSMECLFSIKSNRATRDHLLAWVIEEEARPFSFNHVCADMKLNVEQMRGQTARLLMVLKRRLKIEADRGDISINGADYLTWLSERDKVIQPMLPIEKLDDSDFNLVETEAHYVREHDHHIKLFLSH